MFYSHEVLTSRKYGVATVWLVATIGTASERRKVKRAEIEHVNVPKACRTITNTDTPLALRLQSNLLFGVSRVYSQQCTFVLKDAEHVRMQVRLAMSVLKGASTTTPSTKANRPMAITFEDDPDFVLDTELMPGLELDYEPFHLSQESRLFSLEMGSKHDDNVVRSSPSQPHHPRTPSDDYSAGSDAFGLASLGPSSDASSRQTSSQHMLQSAQQDPNVSALLDDPGFGFDAEGNIFDGPQETILHRTASLAPSANIGPVAESLRQGHDHNLFEDLNLPLGNGENLNSDAQPLSILGHDSPHLEDQEQSPQSGMEQQADEVMGVKDGAVGHEEDEDGKEEGEEEEEEEEEEGQRAIAQSRAQRSRRSLTLDDHMELRNSEYAYWDQNYAEMMATATKSRQGARLAQLARINAHHWVEESGALGLSMQLNIPSTLRIFSGSALYAAFTGRVMDASSSLSKRSRSPAAVAGEDEGQERRVRPRLSLSSEAGRAGYDLTRQNSHQDPPPPPPLPTMAASNDLDMDLGVEQGLEDSVEVGRQGETPLADHRSSSRMPWNISASLRGAGSSAARGMIQRGLPSVLGGRTSSIMPSGGEYSRGGSMSVPGMTRGSIATAAAAASPLTGYPRDSLGGEARGSRLLDDEDETFQLAMGDQMELGQAGSIGDDEAHDGDGMHVTTGEPRPSWLSGNGGSGGGSNDTDLQDFYAFVVDAIAAGREGRDRDGGGGGDDGTVTFEELLPPKQHGRDAAALGLMHVLALQGRGICLVQQGKNVGFLPIVIGVV